MMMATNTLILALAALTGLCVVAAVSLRGWQGWLTLKQQELEARRAATPAEAGSTTGMARIEIADLKERIRKLEAIAAGVDL